MVLVIRNNNNNIIFFIVPNFVTISFYTISEIIATVTFETVQCEIEDKQIILYDYLTFLRDIPLVNIVITIL